MNKFIIHINECINDVNNDGDDADDETLRQLGLFEMFDVVDGACRGAGEQFVAGGVKRRGVVWSG